MEDRLDTIKQRAIDEEVEHRLDEEFDPPKTTWEVVKKTFALKERSDLFIGFIIVAAFIQTGGIVTSIALYNWLGDPAWSIGMPVGGVLVGFGLGFFAWRHVRKALKKNHTIPERREKRALEIRVGLNHTKVMCDFLKKERDRACQPILDLERSLEKDRTKLIRVRDELKTRLKDAKSRMQGRENPPPHLTIVVSKAAAALSEVKRRIRRVDTQLDLVRRRARKVEQRYNQLIELAEEEPKLGRLDVIRADLDESDAQLDALCAEAEAVSSTLEAENEQRFEGLLTDAGVDLSVVAHVSVEAGTDWDGVDQTADAFDDWVRSEDPDESRPQLALSVDNPEHRN